MDLTAELQRLRNMRRKGAAKKIRKASSMRVQVVPADQDRRALCIAGTGGLGGALWPTPELGAVPRSAQWSLARSICRCVRREDRREHRGGIELAVQRVPAQGQGD